MSDQDMETDSDSTRALQVDKVAYLRETRALPSAAARRARLLLLQGQPAAAEDALLAAQLPWPAVQLHVARHAWPRALAVAQRSGDERLVDAVLWQRCGAVAGAGCLLRCVSALVPGVSLPVRMVGATHDMCLMHSAQRAVAC